MNEEFSAPSAFMDEELAARMARLAAPTPDLFTPQVQPAPTFDDAKVDELREWLCRNRPAEYQVGTHPIDAAISLLESTPVTGCINVPGLDAEPDPVVSGVLHADAGPALGDIGAALGEQMAAVAMAATRAMRDVAGAVLDQELRVESAIDRHPAGKAINPGDDQ